MSRNFESNGESMLPRERFISARPVSACAISRKISEDLCLADISAIIWPLFAAGPKSCGSNGIIASGSLFSALRNLPARFLAVLAHQPDSDSNAGDRHLDALCAADRSNSWRSANWPDPVQRLHRKQQ